jgi:tryprostatin B 6-hydroxylase
MDVFRPRIAAQALALKQCIASYNAEHKPINVNDVMTWFSFDAMGEIVFGQDFGMTRNRLTHSALVHQHRALALLGPIIDTMWIAQMAFALFPFVGKVRDWMAMVAFCEEQMARRVEVSVAITLVFVPL